MNERFFLVGEFNNITTIMDTFLCIEKYFVSIFSHQVDCSFFYDNYEIRHLDDSVNFDANDFVVISISNDYEGYKKFICNNFGVDEKNVIYARDWLLEMIKNKKLILRPSTVRLELSTICQLNCRECYMRKNNYGAVGKGYLTFEKFKDFVDKNEFIKHIEVSNSGEVFLNPDLEKILKYSSEKGIKISMDNGVNLNSVSSTLLEAIVKYGVLSMTVSIDGATNDVYSYYRRNGNFEKVLGNIKKINELKKAYNTDYPIMTWQFVVMNHNVDEADLAKKIAYENGMQIFYKKDWSSDYNPEIIDKVSELVGFDVSNKYSDYSGCWDLIFCPQVNWDGRLLGCSFLYWDDWDVNVFDNDFIETINNNPRYLEAIYQILGDDKNLNFVLPCGDCKIKPINV